MAANGRSALAEENAGAVRFTLLYPAGAVVATRLRRHRGRKNVGVRIAAVTPAYYRRKLRGK